MSRIKRLERKKLHKNLGAFSMSVFSEFILKIMNGESHTCDFDLTTVFLHDDLVLQRINQQYREKQRDIVSIVFDVDYSDDYTLNDFCQIVAYVTYVESKEDAKKRHAAMSKSKKTKKTQKQIREEKEIAALKRLQAKYPNITL